MGNAARKIYKEIQALPPGERRDLVLLLAGDPGDDLCQWSSVSEPSFGELWDNEYDAVYDAMPSR